MTRSPEVLAARASRVAAVQAAIAGNHGAPPADMLERAPLISEWCRVALGSGGACLSGVISGHPHMRGLTYGSTARLLLEGPGWALTEGRLYRRGRPRAVTNCLPARAGETSEAPTP